MRMRRKRRKRRKRSRRRAVAPQKWKPCKARKRKRTLKKPGNKYTCTTGIETSTIWNFNHCRAPPSSHIESLKCVKNQGHMQLSPRRRSAKAHRTQVPDALTTLRDWNELKRLKQIKTMWVIPEDVRTARGGIIWSKLGKTTHKTQMGGS